MKENKSEKSLDFDLISASSNLAISLSIYTDFGFVVQAESKHLET